MVRIFGEISTEEFLGEYWQKKPLLVRGAFPAAAEILDPEELAGLSLEDGTTSRLIIQNGKNWTVEHGPFPESRFQNLPGENYTLLVQEVDHYHSDVLRLKRYFRFLPDWRLDDVMVSYAASGGGVGPHVDHYDVFLIQGSGRRKWQIGQRLFEEPDYVPEYELKIMKDFQVTEEWVLEPGDMLYLPPMVPHNGIALEPCMTYSVGFRAPAKEEILTAWIEAYCKELSAHDRYQDSLTLKPTVHPGELTADALQSVARWLGDIPRDQDSMAQWFGRLVTEPKRQNSSSEISNYIAIGVSDVAIETFHSALENFEELEWAESVRLAFYQASDSVFLFVDGELLELHSSFLPIIKHLSIARNIDQATFKSWSNIEGAEELLAAFHHLGILQVIEH